MDSKRLPSRLCLWGEERFGRKEKKLEQSRSDARRTWNLVAFSTCTEGGQPCCVPLTAGSQGEPNSGASL